MGAPTDLTHPALTLIASGTLEEIGDRISSFPWDSTVFVALGAPRGPAMPTLVVDIDHHDLNADELITEIGHEAHVFGEGLPMGDAQSIDVARRTHFEGSGQPSPDFATAFLHYLSQDAYIQPGP